MVYEQYSDGRRDGLRSLFKPCREGCSEGHLWLTQDWSHGQLKASHLVTESGAVESIQHAADSSASHPALQLAVDELDAFERQFTNSEKWLRQSLVALERHQQQLRHASQQASRQQLLALQTRAFGQMRVQIPTVSSVRRCRSG